MARIAGETYCALCTNLKFMPFSNPAHFQTILPDHRVLKDHSQDELLQAAEKGCQYCDLACQAALLLRSATETPMLSIIVYEHHPTELHALASTEAYDVVEIYASSESSTQSFPSLGNDVPFRSDSPESFKFLQTCYNTCIQNHDDCRQRRARLPSRVVDISGPVYRLVEPNADAGGNYAALSYCWGKSGQKIATKKTMDDLRAGIQRDKVPVVFEDAVTVARALGINFLWIDTICIIQDDENDWKQEAAKMADIFENATITIAASSSPNTDVSFLGQRLPHFRDVRLNHRLENGDQPTVFKARRKISLGMHTKSHQSISIDPLDTRAWALQEKELSTRFVSFTGAEIQWRCKEARLCECQNTSFPLATIYSNRSNPENEDWKTERYNEWHQIVEDYSSRRLSFITDKVPALAGLATKFNAVLQSTYLAGLWKENLVRDLAWQRDARTALSAELEYVSPSFSWMSIAGPSDYQPARDSYPGSRIYHCEVVDARCETVGPGISSLVTGGSMVVRGPTIMSQLRSPTAQIAQSYTLQIGNMTFTPSTFQPGVCEFSIDTLLVHTETKTNAELNIKEPTLQRALGQGSSISVDGAVKLLSLYTISHPKYVYGNFLILGKSRTNPDAYERLGIGTGKIYAGKGRKVNVVGHTGPFEWLVAASELMRRDVDEVTTEVITCF